jgi:hypothetical protein
VWILSLSLSLFFSSFFFCFLGLLWRLYLFQLLCHVQIILFAFFFHKTELSIISPRVIKSCQGIGGFLEVLLHSRSHVEDWLHSRESESDQKEGGTNKIGNGTYTIAAGAENLVGEAPLTSLALSPQAGKPLLQVVGLGEAPLVELGLLALAV